MNAVPSTDLHFPAQIMPRKPPVKSAASFLLSYWFCGSTDGPSGRLKYSRHGRREALSACGNWSTDLNPERANNQRVNRSLVATKRAPELAWEIRSFRSARTATNGESLERRMRTVDGFKMRRQRTRILTITGGVCDIGNAS